MKGHSCIVARCVPFFKTFVSSSDNIREQLQKWLHCDLEYPARGEKNTSSLCLGVCIGRYLA